jgi:Eukaryotic aspartyl protease
MGDYYFGIPPEEYLYQFSGETWCLIGFSQMEDDTWLIGDVFLRNYYSVWDHDNDRIGLTPHSLSSADTISVATLPLPT